MGTAVVDRQDNDAQKLAFMVFCQGKTIMAAGRELEFSPTYAYKLADSETYRLCQMVINERLGLMLEGFMDEQQKRLQGMIPKALDRLEDVLVNSLQEGSVLRAVENTLDRGGLPRQTKSEEKHIFTLSPEAIKLLLQGDKEADAVDLVKGEGFKYALERPDSKRSSERAEGEVEREGQEIHVLHGQVDNRLQGSGPGAPRSDEHVDRERPSEEARLSPARSFEDLALDDSGHVSEGSSES